MKKIILNILIGMVFLIAACSNASNKQVTTTATSNPTVTTVASSAGSDATTDKVSTSITETDNVQNDLNTDGLNELDSGLGQIQNI